MLKISFKFRVHFFSFGSGNGELFVCFLESGFGCLAYYIICRIIFSISSH